MQPLLKFRPSHLVVPFGKPFKIKLEVKPNVLGTFSVTTTLSDNAPYVFMVEGDPYKVVTHRFQLQADEHHKQFCTREIEVLIKSYKNNPNNIFIIKGFAENAEDNKSRNKILNINTIINEVDEPVA